jgi:hypothetical protein
MLIVHPLEEEERMLAPPISTVGSKSSRMPATRRDRELVSLPPFAALFLRGDLLEQADSQRDQRHRDEQSAGPRHDRSHRASVLLPTSEVEEEASRLGDDPHEQEQAGQPLNSGRVSGAVKVQEINQRQYK